MPTVKAPKKPVARPVVAPRPTSAGRSTRSSTTPARSTASSRSAPAVTTASVDPIGGTWVFRPEPPITTEERLVRIHALAERIAAHVKYICSAGGLSGTSREAKDQAVEIFHSRLLAMEAELNRIQENLRLG